MINIVINYKENVYPTRLIATIKDGFIYFKHPSATSEYMPTFNEMPAKTYSEAISLIVQEAAEFNDVKSIFIEKND